MHQKVKLTKRQIKEDRFTAFMLKSRSWFQDNWQFLIIGLAATVLLIIAVVYYANSRVAREQEAAVKYSRALLDYRNGNNQIAILGLSQILEEYGSSDAANQATFLLGKLNYRIKNYAEATRYFEMCISKYPNDKINRAASLAGVASCLEDQGKYLEAAEKFAQAYEEYPDGPLIGDYQMAALRNYLETGNAERARAHLDTIKVKFKGTELTNRAIRLFGEKNPE